MNLSSIIHNEHRNSQSHSRHQAIPQFNHNLPTRTRKPSSYERNMATVLTPSSYTSPPHLYNHATYPSPSPPLDDSSANRLPSIQSLIGMADPNVPDPEQLGKPPRQWARPTIDACVLTMAAELEKLSQAHDRNSQPPEAISQGSEPPALSIASASTSTPPSSQSLATA